MTTSHGRLLLLGALGACALSLAALPGLARSATRTSTVSVSVTPASEFSFKLSTKTVRLGSVTFNFTNGGVLPHDLKVCSASTGGTATSCTGKATPLVDPGTSHSLTVSFTKVGKYEYLCTVPGHAAAGMRGLLIVTR